MYYVYRAQIIVSMLESRHQIQLTLNLNNIRVICCKSSESIKYKLLLLSMKYKWRCMYYVLVYRLYVCRLGGGRQPRVQFHTSTRSENNTKNTAKHWSEETCKRPNRGLKIIAPRETACYTGLGTAALFRPQVIFTCP